MKNYQNQKGVLLDCATQVKNGVVKLVQKTELTSTLASELMHILFGPNTQLKLATRKNQDLMKAIA